MHYEFLWSLFIFFSHWLWNDQASSEHVGESEGQSGQVGLPVQQPDMGADVRGHHLGRRHRVVSRGHLPHRYAPPLSLKKTGNQ